MNSGFRYWPISQFSSVSISAEGNIFIIISGVYVGFVFQDFTNRIKDIIFACLSGIFLYTSLSTFIPLLEKLMVDKRRITRIFLALFGFISAILIIHSLIFLKKGLKEDKFYLKIKSFC